VTRILTAAPVAIPGPAGKLEALIERPHGIPHALAVLCHPHPQQRGTMHNKVVSTLARTFARSGAVALRFNFRGVGGSAGEYTGGVGERDDALAAARWCAARWPGLPVYLGGFSFGAAVALTAAAAAGARGLVTVALPIERLPADVALPQCRWLLVHGAADDVVPAGPVVAWARALSAPPEIVVLDGVGHFFHGQLRVLGDTVAEFLSADFRGAADSAGTP
jgi:alpha/beta superfamily hydrolase